MAPGGFVQWFRSFRQKKCLLKNVVITPNHLIRRHSLFPESTFPVNTSTPKETAHTLLKAKKTGTETRQALASTIFWLTGFSFLSLLICFLLCNWRSLVKENGPVSSWGAAVISLLSLWLHCVYLGALIFPPAGFPHTQGCQASNDAMLGRQWILHGRLIIFAPGSESLRGWVHSAVNQLSNCTAWWMACIIYIQMPPPPVDCYALSFQPGRWIKAVVIYERLAAPWPRSLVAYYGSKPLQGSRNFKCWGIWSTDKTGDWNLRWRLLLRFDRKSTVREYSHSMKWNKNSRYKSHIFQLQIPENLCVSLVRHVDNITNPVIQTQSVLFSLNYERAYQYHTPFSFSIILSFSHWIELKFPVHTFQKTFLPSPSPSVASVSSTMPLRPPSVCQISHNHPCLHQFCPMLIYHPFEWNSKTPSCPPTLSGSKPLPTREEYLGSRPG